MENGEQFDLDKLRGSYVLVDFWGSWCGPCRHENPGLVKLYQKFNDKQFVDGDNFEIVSIAVETAEGPWKRAIKKDNLYWPYHFTDFKRFKSDIVKAYGVREIPTKYLIDPKGEIISVNDNIEQIEAILTKALP